MKMKQAIRIFAMLLVAVMMLSALASCGGNGDTTTPAGTTAPSGDITTAPTTNKWEGVDFTGETLRVEYSTYTQTQLTAEGAKNFNQYLVGPDDYTSIAVDNAVFERNTRVIDQLGFAIEWMETDVSSTNQFLPHFESVSMAETPPDIVVNQHYGLIRAAVNGLLYNMREDYGNYDKNLFDFDGADSDNWYKNLMESATLNKDKIYIAAGDFLFDSLRMSYNVFVNVDMFGDLFTLQGGMDYLYDLVLNPSGDEAWTYDKLKEMADIARPVGTDPNSEDAVVGLMGTKSFVPRAFFYSSGLEIFDYSETGAPSYITDAAKKQELHTYVDKMISLFGTESMVRESKYDVYSATFLNGKALFSSEQHLANLEGSNFLNMDDAAAVVPYPKYNTANDYKVLVSDNACAGAILFASQKFTAASAYLQMMTEESAEVYTEYFDQGLKLKNNASNDARQVEVLNLIRNAVDMPLAFLFDNLASRNITTGSGANPLQPNSASTIYDIIEHALTNNTNAFSSIWDSEVEAKNRELQSVVDVFSSK